MVMSLKWARTGAVVIAAVAALGAGAYFGLQKSETSASAQATAGLLGLDLPDVEGRQQAMAQWRGKVVVVNFWATWCAPCREEMPEFVKAQTEFGEKGLQFVGVAVDQADKTREFAKEMGLNYPILVGGLGAMQLSKTLGNSVMALPFTVVVDRKGQVAYTQLGVLRPDKLRSIIAQLL
jgi:peroxiredoxin